MPAGSAGAPSEDCATLMSVGVVRAPEGMTTFAPLDSLTVPPAAPMPVGAGGAGGLLVPLLPPPLSSPPPPHPADKTSNASAIPRAVDPSQFMLKFLKKNEPHLSGTTTLQCGSGHGQL